ncbi:MAG: transcriptional regulator TrmB [Candidatus Saccharibacteria bacterium]|nr:transcriptional regulator TrmB [Candidatus Saccharibacteria bacterium]
MDKILSKILVELGCSEKHVRFYKATLQLGEAPLAAIAETARLQRSTAYLLAAELLKMGLIEEDHKAYHKFFTAVEPETLLRKAQARQRVLGRNVLAFRDALPELQAAHQATTSRPRVRTYEGSQGLLAVWKDILDERLEVLLWTNQQTEQQIFTESAHELFIRERVNKDIPMRVLAADNPEGKALLAGDATMLRQTKLLPPDVYFSSETYIYGNKVAVLDFGKSFFGVITENQQIAASQRSIFDLTWSSL